MKLGMGCFGLTCAALVAVPVATAAYTALSNASASLDPNRRWQLTFELDGDYYVADHDLTFADCQRALKSTRADPDSFPANGHGRYSCDPQPKVTDR